MIRDGHALGSTDETKKEFPGEAYSRSCYSQQGFKGILEPGHSFTPVTPRPITDPPEPLFAPWASRNNAGIDKHSVTLTNTTFFSHGSLHVCSPYMYLMAKFNQNHTDQSSITTAALLLDTGGE